jgi:8-oxo-dGTP diphosphatase
MAHAQPITTVDVALFTLSRERLCVLLARRDKPPFADAWALPGGFVHPEEDEDLAGTARRVLRDKTSAKVSYLEQLCTFSGRARDPRGWSISVAYYALLPEGELGALDGEVMQLAPIDKLPSLPFDHRQIIETATTRLRNKASYSSLPSYLLAPTFTLAELKKVYEQVIGVELERTSFRRNMLAQEVIEPVPGKTRGGAHRPAQLFRRKGRALREFDRVL